MATPIPADDFAASARPAASNPTYQAYQILHWGYTVIPILAGLDKFFHLMVNWDQYLAPMIQRVLPFSGHAFMLAVGVVEVIAGLLVLMKPRIGGLIVGLWLLGIMVNLLLHSGSYDGAGWGLDLAARDLGLALGAFALARLSAGVEESSA